MKNFKRIIAVLGLVLMPMAFAQSSRGGLAVKVVAPVILADALEVHVALSEIPKDSSEYRGKWQSLRLNAYDFGKWHKLKLGETKILRFFSEPDANSKELGRVRLTATSGKQLLFFVGNPKEKTYQVVTVNNSEVEWGEYGVLNNTRNKMMFQFGESKKLIKPNAITTVKAPSEIFKVRIFMEVDKKAKQVRDTKWRLAADQREFILCMNWPNTGRMRWVHVRDSKQYDVFNEG